MTTTAEKNHRRPYVLVLDLFEDEGEMYAEYLQAVGFDVQVYTRPAHAFAAIADRRPDVVVTRLRQAAAIDGIEVVRRLKNSARTASVPVVMITSSMLSTDRTAAAQVACDAYLILPVVPDQLEQEIRRVLGQPRAPGC